MTDALSGSEAGPVKVETVLQTMGLLLARAFLGLLFVAAGFPKTQATDNFAVTILSYELLPPSLIPALAGYLPWFEVLIGLALLLGLFTRAGAVGAAILSGSFALAISSAVIRGLDIDCGCFAVESQADWPHVLLNLLSLLLALFLMLRGGGKFALDEAFSLTEKTVRNQLGILGLAILLLLLNLFMGWKISSTVQAPSALPAKSSAPLPLPSPELTPPPSTPELSPLPEQSASPGKLIFDPPLLDLGGGIMQGESTVAEATYRNSGGSPLTILKVDKTCGCTEVHISHEVLNPGEQGTLTVEFQADDTTGELLRSLQFTLKDQPETVTYLLRVEVESVVSLEPKQLSLKPGEPRLVRLERQQEGEDFQVLQLESPDPRIVVDNLKKIGPSTFTFEVKLGESIESKESEGTFSVVQVHTDLSNLPVLRLLVSEASP